MVNHLEAIECRDNMNIVTTFTFILSTVHYAMILRIMDSLEILKLSFFLENDELIYDMS